MRPRSRALVVVVATVAAAASLSAVAPPAAAVTSISVRAGYEDTFVPGRSFPVRVTVRPDRLVDGTLRVRAEGQGGPAAEVHLPVEVPGGSAKEFVVVVPSSSAEPGAGVEVSARLVDGRTEVGRSAEVPVRAPAGQELVGLLPGVLAGAPPPGPAPLAVDAGVARFVAVGAAELAQAPASLGPLGALGLADGELGRLSPTSKAGVLRWVAAGGQLLVDAAPGARVEGLPEAWQPGPSGRSAAGRGQVVLTAGAMAGGQWAGLVEPRVLEATTLGEGRGDVGRALATDAGLRIPPLGWLLLFLLVYVAVVGPVTAGVLSRLNRPELAWVVIPLAAVVFTVASWAGARGLRSGTRLAHGTVVEATAAGSNATTFVGLAARTRQRTGVGFGDGWTAERAATGFDPAAAVVEITPDGAVARLQLDAGEFDVVRGEGPIAGGDGLEVEAVSDTDGVARGIVRNRLPHPLEEVVVLVGGSGTLVGTVGAGQERAWEVRMPRHVEHDHAGGIERSLWRQQFDQDPDSVVNLALWNVSGPRADPFSRGPGVAIAAGWTREFTPPVVVGGARRRPVGRTVVVSSGPVRPGGPALTDLAVRRDVVRSAEFVPGQRVFVDQGPFTVMRFTVPEGGEGRPLVARVPRAGGATSVWAGGRWTPLHPGVGGNQGNQFLPPRGIAGEGDVPGAPPRVVRPVRPGVTAVPVPPAVDVFPGGADRGIPTVDVEIPPAAVDRSAVWLRVETGGFAQDVPGVYTLRERT